MSRIFGNKWLYRMVRATTHPVREEEARTYRKRLAFVYMLSSGTLYLTWLSNYEADKAEKRNKYGDEDNAAYWMQATGCHDAKVVRISGLSSYTVEELDLNKIRAEEAEKERIQKLEVQSEN